MKGKPLTPDAQVTLLLCSHLALPKGTTAAKLKPLSPSEWNDLAAALVARRIRPSVLLEMGPEPLGLSAEMANRVTQLLARGAQLAIEVERLGSLGIWVLTRSDDAYPPLLKERLGVSAPPVLFGAGEPALLTSGFLAVVGSRDVDESGSQFARQVGEACARDGKVLVSGGAKGVDRLSMEGCLQRGGKVIGVLADSLERTLREPTFRTAVSEKQLVLVSAVHPKAPFNVANAMARNKLIYCLAQYGLVVASSLEKGGTRAGALEVLKQRWVPLLARSGPVGNLDLIKQGALAFPAEVPDQLEGWLREQAVRWKAVPTPGRRKALVDPGKQDSNDLFPVVWPHIAERLGKWPTAEELARHLCVEREQVAAWLERAAGQGLVSRVGDRFALPGSEAKQVRFDMG